MLSHTKASPDLPATPVHFSIPSVVLPSSDTLDSSVLDISLNAGLQANDPIESIQGKVWIHLRLWQCLRLISCPRAVDLQPGTP